jgi:hypothetical protein
MVPVALGDNAVDSEGAFTITLFVMSALVAQDIEKECSSSPSPLFMVFAHSIKSVPICPSGPAGVPYCLYAFT